MSSKAHRRHSPEKGNLELVRQTLDSRLRGNDGW
jgi:hypothetical protein